MDNFEFDLAVYVLQLQAAPANLSDSSPLLATVSQHELNGNHTAVADISEQHNATTVTIATVLDHINSRGSSSNQSALFEKNTLSQQDQCWETYVGQVVTKHSH